MAEVIIAEHISKRYHTDQGETEAIRDVSFSVCEKEFVSMIGPSGCGKSTLLSIIAGLESPSGGRVSLTSVNGRKARVAYMLQEDHLFPWLTVRDNALLGLKIRHELTDRAAARVDGLLEQYGLSRFVSAYPSHLSGGMRQRAALIRTLAVDPDLLLLDEPFSALDAQTRLAVSDDIFSIIRRQGKAALLITHDISEAIGMSDRVMVLSPRPAVVKSVHTVTLPGFEGPLARRRSPGFSGYFQTLWKELNGHE